MARYLHTVVVLLAVSLLSGCDQQSLPQAPMLAAREQPRIGVIDIDRVARELGRDEVMRERLQSANEQSSTELRTLAGELREQLRIERDKLGETPDQAGLERLSRLGLEAQQRVQESQAAALRSVQELRLQLSRELQDELRPVAAEVARERGVVAVILANFLLWAEASTDLTDAVIQRMRPQQAPSEE